MRQVVSNRSCSICKCTSADKWNIGKNLITEMGSLSSKVHVQADDWVCGACFSGLVWPKSSGKKYHKFSQARTETLEYCLEVLEKDGTCLIKNIMSTYKQMVESKYQCSIENSEYESFKRILKMNLSTKGYSFFSPYKTANSMCYNPSIFSNTDRNLGAVYNLLNKQTTYSTDGEDIRNLVRRQAAIFPKSKDFDYRKLFQGRVGDADDELNKYFDGELMDFIDKVTLSDKTHTCTSNPSNAYTFTRKLKCMMVCSILANTMDPRACFMQTLLGLACYSQGLRDKGVALLNAFGVTSSAFHIREHGSLWAKLRSAIKEINLRAFWRVTFDNLDFRMKLQSAYQQEGI